METILPMTCRDCHTLISPTVAEVDKRKKVNSYDDCYYKCPQCGVGYTNAKSAEQRTKIFSDYKLNFPEQVRTGLDQVIQRSLNKVNQKNKVNKLAFETSEDALTWTVFRYLHSRHEVGIVLGLGSMVLESLYFWGCPWPLTNPTPVEQALAEVQIKTLQEKVRQLTEPDVIFVSSEEVVFVEVKYHAGNDSRPGYSNFDTYLKNADGMFSVASDVVKSKGHYELVRNWVIGILVAKQLNRRFRLINLASNSCSESSAEFEKLLNPEAGKFQFVSWRDVIGRLRFPIDEWFVRYLLVKGFEV